MNPSDQRFFISSNSLDNNDVSLTNLGNNQKNDESLSDSRSKVSGLQQQLLNDSISQNSQRSIAVQDTYDSRIDFYNPTYQRTQLANGSTLAPPQSLMVSINNIQPLQQSQDQQSSGLTLPPWNQSLQQSNLATYQIEQQQNSSFQTQQSIPELYSQRSQDIWNLSSNSIQQQQNQQQNFSNQNREQQQQGNVYNLNQQQHNIYNQNQQQQQQQSSYNQHRQQDQPSIDFYSRSSNQFQTQQRQNFHQNSQTLNSLSTQFNTQNGDSNNLFQSSQMQQSYPKYLSLSALSPNIARLPEQTFTCQNYINSSSLQNSIPFSESPSVAANENPNINSYSSPMPFESFSFAGRNSSKFSEISPSPSQPLLKESIQNPSASSTRMSRISSDSEKSSSSKSDEENVLDIDRPKYWDVQDNTYFEYLAVDSQVQNKTKSSDISNMNNDHYFEFSSHHTLVKIYQLTVLKKDVPSLSFYNSLMNSKNITMLNNSYSGDSKISDSKTLGDSLLDTFKLSDIKTSFESVMVSARAFFDWHRNPNAFYYLKLYLNFIYLRGNVALAAETFNNVVRSLRATTEDISLYNKEIWSVIFALRANRLPYELPTEKTSIKSSIFEEKKDRPLGKKNKLLKFHDPNTNNVMVTTGVRTVKACSNLCMVSTDDSESFKCLLCGSTETVCLEYLSPRTLINHMMNNPIVSRSIKSTPIAKHKLINDIWDSEVVKNLRALGVFKSPYDLLLNVVIDCNNSFKTSGVELVQVSIMLLNLPPSERVKKEFLIPVFYFPKHTKHNRVPVDIASYMKVIVDDIKEMGSTGFRVYDGDTRKYEICKAYVGFVTADPYSLNYVMGYAPRFNGSPCWTCFAHKTVLSNDNDNSRYLLPIYHLPESHYYGVQNFQYKDEDAKFKDSREQINFLPKDMMWYKPFHDSFQHINGSQTKEDCIKAGVLFPNSFLELGTMFLPHSFVPDISNLYYDLLAQKFFTLLFSRGNEFYKRSVPKSFRSSIEAHNRFCYVIDIINESLPNQWLEEPFDAGKLLKGVPGALTSHQVSRILKLFPIIYEEVFRSNDDIEDRLILEYNLLMQIAVSRDISKGAIDFLESAFPDVVKTFESILTADYTIKENISILSPAVHATLHIPSYLRNCGNLSSLSPNQNDRMIKNFSGAEEQQDLGNSSLPDMDGSGSNGMKTTSANGITALQAITDINIQTLAVRLLVPTESTMKTGSIRLLLPRKNYQPIEKSWETLSNSEKQGYLSQDNDKFFDAILFSKLNRLVWRFFKRNKTFQICNVNPETGKISFPDQNDIFLDPEKCERFKTCFFTSSNARAHVENVVRLKSKDKARYCLAQDFISVRFTVCNPDGSRIREMEKTLVLFTELTTQLKKLSQVPEAIDTRKAFKKGTKFGPGVNSSGPLPPKISEKCHIVYGYYYTFPYNDEDAADYKNLGRVYCEPPAEQRWDVAPVESISNPVYSIPVVSKDRKSVTVHLVDTMYNCEIQAGTQNFSIDMSIAEYDVNETYEKEIVKYKYKPSKY